MCTLSLLARRGGGYLLAMNRDERVTRGVAEPPQRTTRGGATFLAPRDADAGGTWIAVDRGGRTLCLMNGDRPAAGVEPPAAARSRGELVLDLMGMGDPEPDAVEFALRERWRRGTLRYRPFQLVTVTASAGVVQVGYVAFDGLDVSSRRTGAPLLLTSNGFDPEGVERRRRARFDEFLATRAAASSGSTRSPEQEAAALRDELFELHASHSADAPQGGLFTFCMHRPEVRSVSTTLVEVTPMRVAMSYRPGPPCERAAIVEVALA